MALADKGRFRQTQNLGDASFVFETQFVGEAHDPDRIAAAGAIGERLNDMDFSQHRIPRLWPA